MVDEIRARSIGGKMTGKKRSTRREICLTVTLSTTYSISTVLRSSKRASAVGGQRLTAGASQYVTGSKFIRIIPYLRDEHEMNA
jgi:hypothetical protein